MTQVMFFSKEILCFQAFLTFSTNAYTPSSAVLNTWSLADPIFLLVTPQFPTRQPPLPILGPWISGSA